MNPAEPTEHFFRHEYSRLVATLSHRVGAEHLELVEDAVQSALLSGLEAWKVSGLPQNPTAWLYRVAHNAVLDDLRQRTRHHGLLEQAVRHTDADADADADSGPQVLLDTEMQDDLLRMLFMCCDPDLPVEAQLVLALKVLCGFDVRKIAARLFISEANVYKRLGRARARLRNSFVQTDALSAAAYAPRLASVQHILYLLFTEGHLSSHAELALRRELCDEAIRLATLLTAHPVGQSPATAALLALMHLHRARMTARADESGGLLLLDEQPRNQWDAQDIALGLQWLAESARGDVLSRFHVEAGIAAEHCLAPTYAETRWEKISEAYALLSAIAPSPMVTLNRAVAGAECDGPEVGLAIVRGETPPTWLAGSYLWSAVLADLHARCGHEADAIRYRELAFTSAPNARTEASLRRRLRDR